MSYPAIKVENLSKQYRLGERTSYKTIRESIANITNAPLKKFKNFYYSSGVCNSISDNIWALNKVTFEVQPGEVIGIIGRNGAGKSTLLKILSKITDPSAGRAELRGKIGSLLEVGTGFHPELTGHENIYLYGAILGMDRYEVTRKFEKIIAFAGIEKFIETPVKKYSSGMYMRLAFSVAAYLESEILLIDEVLAVGDAEFQKKCIGKVGDIAGQGRTVLFVSHNMEAIRQLCQRTILLENGHISMDAETDKTIKKYLSAGLEDTDGYKIFDYKSAPGDEFVNLKSVKLKNESGVVSTIYQINEGIIVEVEYNVLKPISNYHTSFQIFTQNGVHVFSSGDWDFDQSLTKKILPGRYKARCKIPGDYLNWGSYYITIIGLVPSVRYHYIADSVAKWEISQIGGAGGVASRTRQGIVRPRLKWQISETN